MALLHNQFRQGKAQWECVIVQKQLSVRQNQVNPLIVFGNIRVQFFFSISNIFRSCQSQFLQKKHYSNVLKTYKAVLLILICTLSRQNERFLKKYLNREQIRVFRTQKVTWYGHTLIKYPTDIKDGCLKHVFIVHCFYDIQRISISRKKSDSVPVLANLV